VTCAALATGILCGTMVSSGHAQFVTVDVDC